MTKPTVFISYSHKDENWKDRFKPQLDALEMADQIVVWDDRDIDGGDINGILKLKRPCQRLLLLYA